MQRYLYRIKNRLHKRSSNVVPASAPAKERRKPKEKKMKNARSLMAVTHTHTHTHTHTVKLNKEVKNIEKEDRNSMCFCNTNKSA